MIHTEKFSRRMSLSELDRKKFETDLKGAETAGAAAEAEAFKKFLVGVRGGARDEAVKDDDGRELRKIDDDKFLAASTRPGSRSGPRTSTSAARRSARRSASCSGSAGRRSRRRSTGRSTASTA